MCSTSRCAAICPFWLQNPESLNSVPRNEIPADFPTEAATQFVRRSRFLLLRSKTQVDWLLFGDRLHATSPFRRFLNRTFSPPFFRTLPDCCRPRFHSCAHSHRYRPQ